MALQRLSRSVNHSVNPQQVIVYLKLQSYTVYIVKSSQKPSLTAHLSHQAIASRAGVDPKKWRTPLEHNERRIKIQANVQQRVQGMILQQPTGSPQQPQQPNGRVPVRPPQGLFSGAGVGVSSSMSSGAGSQSGANRPVGQPVAMPGATAAGVARLPTGGPAAAMASMTPAQVQQFIQRQAMVRQGQAAGSPQTLPQGI